MLFLIESSVCFAIVHLIMWRILCSLFFNNQINNN